MNTHVTATRRGWVYAPFHCEHCNHDDQGAVRLQVSASTQTSMLQDLDDARDQAMGTAHGNMEQRGDELIALAPCPQCGKRDELAVKNHQRKANPWLAGGGVFLTVGLGGAGFLASKGEPEMGMFLMSPVILLGSIALALGLFKRLRRLPSGVFFRSVDASPWAHLGPPG